ncbi:MAG: siderophore-interacting protein [Actinomycetota bacterium]|nr:siderophore-interacting protein [Actinomycetota bacterium]
MSAASDLVMLPIVMRHLEVRRVEDVTPGMRRIVLGGPQLAAFEADGRQLTAFRSDAFDDHLKIFLPDPATGGLSLPGQGDGRLEWPGQQPAVPILHRDYTPRRFDAAAGELTLDFVRHEGGIASEWAEHARPGDGLHVAGPKASYVYPTDLDWFLLAADETGLPAVGRFVEEARPGTVARIVVEVADEADRQELTPPPFTDITITWVARGSSPVGDSPLLAEAVAAAELPPGNGFAWIAAEHGAAQRVRRHVRDVRAIPAEHTRAKAYWRAGLRQDQAEHADHSHTPA